jgi:hypothetical protein
MSSPKDTGMEDAPDNALAFTDQELDEKYVCAGLNFCRRMLSER